MFALELVQAVRDVHVECEALRDEEEKKYALQVREMTRCTPVGNRAFCMLGTVVWFDRAFCRQSCVLFPRP